MSDEKELIWRIKNSKRQGLSRAEITRRLQSRGYKLEYIDVLFKKIGRGKRIFLWFFLSFIFILLIAGVAGYFMFFQTGGEKMELKNPLEGLKISFGSKSSGNSNIDVRDNDATEGDNFPEINIEDIEITPDFLSYLLNEIGAYKLHKHPLSGEKPYINFDISGQRFYSEIDKDIKTFEGSSESADMVFNAPKTVLINAIISDNPGDVFKQSIVDGETGIEMRAGETELFAKGYLELYEELK